MSPRKLKEEAPEAQRNIAKKREKLDVRFNVLSPVIIHGVVQEIAKDLTVILRLRQPRRGKNQLLYGDISEAALKLHMQDHPEGLVSGGGVIRERLLEIHRDAYQYLFKERAALNLSNDAQISPPLMCVRAEGEISSSMDRAFKFPLDNFTSVSGKKLITLDMRDGFVSFSVPEEIRDSIHEELEMILHGRSVHLGPPRKRVRSR